MILVTLPQSTAAAVRGASRAKIVRHELISSLRIGTSSGRITTIVKKVLLVDFRFELTQFFN
jgi:hypothetical protein